MKRWKKALGRMSADLVLVAGAAAVAWGRDSFTCPPGSSPAGPWP